MTVHALKGMPLMQGPSRTKKNVPKQKGLLNKPTKTIQKSMITIKNKHIKL